MGMLAALKQSPILMHMDSQVHMPDHDNAVSSMHKLIHFGIGDIQIKEKKTFSEEAVAYSGAAYFGVRSAKHNG